MSSRLALLIFAAILPPVSATGAESNVCEGKTAPLMTLSSSWAQIAKAAAALPRGCNDGYFGEGISDTVVRKMRRDWSGFIKQLRGGPENPQFFDLILASMNSTLDPDDIQAVLRLAKSSCPAQLGKQCRAIEKKATDALADYDPPITPMAP